jgi:hypothetical protein
MSALGHSRPSHFVPVLNNVRYASDSDHSRYVAFRMAAGYCGASARIKFDVEQFAALFNELQARGDETKLMQLSSATETNRRTICAILPQCHQKNPPLIRGN